MSASSIVLLLIGGAIYLALWPIRVHLWARKGDVKPATVLLPGLGGILLLVFDIAVLRDIRPEWWLFAAFVHGFLLFFGAAFAVKRINRKRETRG